MAATKEERRAQKRKDLIKNILIVFLVVMLLLTFFSGTIQNWSLPEVATAYVQSGSVSPQIRGSGTVTAEDPYNLTPQETRKIASVAVKAGDEVKKDDVIYYLESGESTELEEASAKLRELESAFEIELFASEVPLSNETITRIRNGQVDSMSGYQAAINDVNARYNEAVDVNEQIKSALEILEAEYAIKTARLSGADTAGYAYSTAQAEAELAQLNAEEAQKQARVAELDAQITTMGKSLATYEAAKREYDLYVEEYRVQNSLPTTEAAETALNGSPTTDFTNKKTAMENAKQDANYQMALDSAINEATGLKARLSEISARKQTLQGIIAANNQSTSNVGTKAEQEKAAIDKDYNTRKAELTAQKVNAEHKLAEVTKEREEKTAAIRAELSLSVKAKEIADQRKKVQELQEKGNNPTVTSPVDGTITSLTYTAGQTMAANEPAAVIQVKGKSMTLQITVTAEQAKRLKAGDVADPQDAWRYSEFKAVLQTLRPDPADPGGSRIATFSIESPDVQAGQTVNIKIGEAQRSYDMTVPNSAIREDNNGKFILLVEARSSPLRNRYIARRVDVDVLASDDTTSAIMAAIEGWNEYVITTSSAPVRAGQEVRLANQ